MLVSTASALALRQVKNKDANQKTQVARETTSMQKQAKATFAIKAWDEKTYNEIEGAPSFHARDWDFKAPRKVGGV